jgi:hypothetical protein
MDKDFRKYLIVELFLIIFVSMLIYFKPPTSNAISCFPYVGENCSSLNSSCCPGLVCVNGQCSVNQNQTQNKTKSKFCYLNNPFTNCKKENISINYLN